MESEPNKQNEVRNRLYCNGEMILQRLGRVATGCIQWDPSLRHVEKLLCPSPV